MKRIKNIKTSGLIFPGSSKAGKDIHNSELTIPLKIISILPSEEVSEESVSCLETKIVQVNSGA